MPAGTWRLNFTAGEKSNNLESALCNASYAAQGLRWWATCHNFVILFGKFEVALEYWFQGRIWERNQTRTERRGGKSFRWRKESRSY